ncbi:MAG: RHS repeat-associated core domain-containing protein, partial [Flavobacteriaceae bacterium]
RNDYLGTTDIMETELDFGGKVVQTRTTHTKDGNSAIVTVDDFTYDHEGRLLRQKQTIGSQSQETLADNTYDNLGQLVQKEVGSGLQTIDYTYNVRGWLKQINNPASLGSDLFAFDINYNTPTHGGTALYNGNIAETEWKTANDGVQRWYSFDYDGLDRITGATSGSGHYNVSGITYDKNGNIQTLKRQGLLSDSPVSNNFGLMDDLVYSYAPNSNRLMKVADGAADDRYGFKDDALNTAPDSSDDYGYDQNGNMLSDDNKGITGIQWNHLNLPTDITVANSEHNGNIKITYAADGTKLKKVSTGSSSGTTEYAGRYIYENGQLKFFSHKEGYVEHDNGNFDYVYTFKDHLGSVRLSYSDYNGNGSIDPTTEIVKEQNTYPFGMPQKGYNGGVNGVENNHKTYLGQETNRELGLDWLTFRFRNYDPSLGRFFGVDPISEKFYDISTYQFAHNTPIWKIELEGLEGIKSQEFNPDGSFKNHVVEKNVVVLTRKTKPLPTFKKGTSQKKIDRVTNRVKRQNRNIIASNKAKVKAVKSELKSFFKGAKNSKGESVDFKFNVTSVATDDTGGGDVSALRPLAISNGMESSETQFKGGPKKIAPAAIISTDNPTGRGLTLGNIKVMTRSDQELGNGALSHEVGHTLITRSESGEHTSSGLMSVPVGSVGSITSKTVDRILEDSHEK